MTAPRFGLTTLRRFGAIAHGDYDTIVVPNTVDWRQELPSISLRSATADQRAEVGHLEGDLIIGTMASHSAIATVFDRASPTYGWRPPQRPHRRPTDPESTSISQTPTHPGNDPPTKHGNCNIRRYVGRRTDLSTYQPRDLRAIETRINTTPRRILGWATARHVYDQAVAMTT